MPELLGSGKIYIPSVSYRPSHSVFIVFEISKGIEIDILKSPRDCHQNILRLEIDISFFIDTKSSYTWKNRSTTQFRNIF